MIRTIATIAIATGVATATCLPKDYMTLAEDRFKVCIDYQRRSDKLSLDLQDGLISYKEYITEKGRLIERKICYLEEFPSNPRKCLLNFDCVRKEEWEAQAQANVAFDNRIGKICRSTANEVKDQRAKTAGKAARDEYQKGIADNP